MLIIYNMPKKTTPIKAKPEYVLADDNEEEPEYEPEPEPEPKPKTTKKAEPKKMSDEQRKQVSERMTKYQARIKKEKEEDRKQLEMILERLNKLEELSMKPKIIKKPVEIETKEDIQKTKDDEPDIIEVVKDIKIVHVDKNEKPKSKCRYFELLEKQQKKII